MELKKYRLMYVIFQTIFSFFFVVLSFMALSSVIKSMISTVMIKDFIKNADSDYVSFGGDTRIYTVYTDEEIDSTINITETEIILGDNGDIFVMPLSAITHNGFFDGFVTTLFGGHAGVTGYDHVPILMEAMGATLEEAYVFRNDYKTDNPDLYKPEERSVVGLRVKTDKGTREDAFKYALSLEGKKYNYWYIFNRNDKYYCSDLCTRIYDDENPYLDESINLDSDGLYVTIQDLIISKNTYITFFKYIDDAGFINIYYLKTR